MSSLVFYVLFANLGQIPELLGLIITSAFAPTEATGAFIGGTVGSAFLFGMKRAVFSNEAGQGSSAIAHAAAKTDEPVREGLVGGMEPFIGHYRGVHVYCPDHFIDRHLEPCARYRVRISSSGGTERSRLDLPRYATRIRRLEGSASPFGRREGR